MSAQVDTLALSQALKAAGLSASGEAVARAMQDIAMRDMPSNSDLREAIHTMTVRVGLMLAGAVAILGALISIPK